MLSFPGVVLWVLGPASLADEVMPRPPTECKKHGALGLVPVNNRKLSNLGSNRFWHAVAQMPRFG
jgi:hypothetical protein